MDGAASVYAIDVDGDADIDILSASNLDDKIAWYENNGNQNFISHTITTSEDGATSVYAIDVDGDTDIDVLSASELDDKIAWYENDGNQNFTAHTITTSADGAVSVYAIDMDGDADMDVLSASLKDDKIAWYENLMITNIDYITSFNTPSKFQLTNNYPNPFNPVTNIEFDVKENCQVTLRIYDIQGKLISTLLDKNMPIGRHKVIFKANHLASGIYFYQITMGNYKATNKMILIR